MSSRVISPATPPYSSVAMASDSRRDSNCWKAAPSVASSGTKEIGRMNSDSCLDRPPARATAFHTSRWCTYPTTLSRESR